jgi:hypothetical protein
MAYSTLSRRRCNVLVSTTLLFCLAWVLIMLPTPSLGASSPSQRKMPARYTVEGTVYAKDALTECDVHLSGPSGRFSAAVHRDASFAM